MSKYIKHIMLSRILEEILPNQPFSHIDNHLFTVVKFYHTPEVASHIHRLLIMRWYTSKQFYLLIITKHCR